MNKINDVVLIRREYNHWVANEPLEDYALRFTAKQSRRWSPAEVASTALGLVSLLALEAFGGAITLVTHAITRVSRFQARTQPIWLVLQILPLVTIAQHESTVFGEWLTYARQASPNNTGFNLLFFGATAAVIFPLIAQNAEQAEFLPDSAPDELNSDAVIKL